MTRPRLVRTCAAGVLAAAGLLLMNSFAPLQLPSVLVYSGLVVCAAGVLSILAPPRWLGFSRRIHGLLAGVAMGAVLFAAGWYWPAQTSTVPSRVSRLDAFMPSYDFHEHHEAIIRAPAARVREALNRVSFADIGVMQTLGTIRAVAMGQIRAAREAKGVAPRVPIVEMIQSPRSGFFPLADTPEEFVFGLAGQPWNNRGVRLKPEEFCEWAPPDTVKIAANFRLADAGNGRTRVVTETRIVASDGTARRKMAQYWALIYPGSGLVRCSLLEAVRERAEHN